MMSRAFKVFLLMLLSFGAIWAYQLRSRDLRSWFDPGETPLVQDDDLVGLRSHVERVVDPRRDSRALATIYFKKPRLVEEVPEPGILADIPIRGGSDAVNPIQADPEEEPPFEIIFKGSLPSEEVQPVRPKEKGTRQELQREEKAKEKAEKPRSKEKSEGKKGDRPKADRLKGTRPDPHTAPADGSRPKREPGSIIAEAEAGDAPGGGSGPRSLIHVVREKETLASLARRYYQNDPEKWKAIFAANQEKIADPHAIAVGLILNIPGVQGAKEERAQEAAGGKGGKKSAAKSGPGRTDRPGARARDG